MSAPKVSSSSSSTTRKPPARPSANATNKSAKAGPAKKASRVDAPKASKPAEKSTISQEATRSQASNAKPVHVDAMAKSLTAVKPPSEEQAAPPAVSSDLITAGDKAVTAAGRANDAVTAHKNSKAEAPPTPTAPTPPEEVTAKPAPAAEAPREAPKPEPIRVDRPTPRSEEMQKVVDAQLAAEGKTSPPPIEIERPTPRSEDMRNVVDAQLAAQAPTQPKAPEVPAAETPKPVAAADAPAKAPSAPGRLDRGLAGASGLFAGRTLLDSNASTADKVVAGGTLAENALTLAGKASRAVPVVAAATNAFDGGKDLVESYKTGSVEKGITGGAKVLGAGALAAGLAFPPAAVVGGGILAGVAVYEGGKALYNWWNSR